MRMKKAQSALEFLTTYGWAFLVILIMIGALAYFGVLDPSRFLPEKCSPDTGFTCKGLVVEASANTFTFAMVNGIGKNIEIGAATFTADQGTTCTVASIEDGAANDLEAAIPAATWAPEAELVVTITCGASEIKSKTRSSGTFTMDYQEAGSSFTKKLKTELSGRSP